MDTERPTFPWSHRHKEDGAVNHPPTARRRYQRGLRWALALLTLVLVVPLIPYGLAGESQLRSSSADLWRDARQTTRPDAFRTQVQGDESAVLINVVGDRWRTFREQTLVPYGGWLLLATVALITLFFLFRGRIRIAGGRSGRLVPRFSSNQRVIHWFAAGLFVLLGVTGLVLLYGRYVLIPLLGPEGFAVTASASKEVHNLFGPIFPFAVVAMIISFGRGNAFRGLDFKWFLRAGGLFGGRHVDAGYYNGGQKSWFWLTLLFGLAISVSGLVLDFPVFGQSRELMAGAHVVHGVVALLFIAVALGHIYIGTLGMEGAVESMTSGYVDAHWAAEHHNLWLAEMERAGLVGVEPNALEEVRRHDDVDFKGFGAPGAPTTEG
jgi:formate dehydrogenase subunit gamma